MSPQQPAAAKMNIASGPPRVTAEGKEVNVGDLVRFKFSNFGHFMYSQQTSITLTTPASSPYYYYTSPYTTYPSSGSTTGGTLYGIQPVGPQYGLQNSNQAVQYNNAETYKTFPPEPPMEALLKVTGVLKNSNYPLEVMDIETGQYFEVYRYQVTPEPFLTRVYQSKREKKLVEIEEDTKLIESAT